MNEYYGDEFGSHKAFKAYLFTGVFVDYASIKGEIINFTIHINYKK